MSAPAVEIPHATGELSESDAIERLLAKNRAGQMSDSVDDDPGTLSDPGDEADSDLEADPDAEPVLEGDEFSADDEDAPTASADPVVKFDDGTELPLSEVKRGFLRQQDYTRKTQEAAELRKSVETERATFLAEKKQAAANIEPLIQAALSIVNNPAQQAELAQLREVDPGAYAVRVMEIQQRQSQLAALQAEQNRLRESAEREEMENYQRERAKAAEQSRATLMETIPAAKKDFNSWYQELGKYVLEQGITAEAWDSEVDHRVILLAWKAKQYDDATRKTGKTTETLRKAPQPMRPGAAKPPGHAQARMLREATERAQASGSLDDAVALRLAKMRASR